MVNSSFAPHPSVQSFGNLHQDLDSSAVDHHPHGKSPQQMNQSKTPGSSVAGGPAGRYADMLDDGSLRADASQAAVVQILDRFHQHLLTMPAGQGDESLLSRLGLDRWRPWGSAKEPSKDKKAAAQGIYMHGPVGRGKSMLMDLFFETAPLEPKRRVHFHAFMQDVHGRLNDLRREGSDQAQDDVISALAAQISAETRLLCFDEFLVQNIADAMILGRLFDHLFDDGVIVVATSNFPPDRLYEKGLNRRRFLPFIDRLKTTLDIVSLAGPTDYRLGRLQNVPIYYSPADPKADQALKAIFARLTDDAAGEADEIAIGSRRLQVPKAARGVAWFDFASLCEEPLGASDYLALTKHYHTLIVRGVPKLTHDKHNEARRFMTLVDALYECRVNLIMSADAEPHDLYHSGEGAFEFERTASRLMEMQSREYMETPPSTVAAADFVPFALTTDLT